jgi:hypothetical protein
MSLDEPLDLEFVNKGAYGIIMKKHSNDINIINCIDNETYYNINLNFNDEQINIITDFKLYCNIIDNEKFHNLNLELIYYNKYEIIDILNAIDNFKNSTARLWINDDFV